MTFDTRHLKRLEDGTYKTGGGKIICDLCALRDYGCGLAPVDRCAHYLPTLAFNNRAGMQKVFNTIRIGKAWEKRIDPGQTIGLWCPDKKELFGHAEVLRVVSGPIQRMLVDHAEHNHLFLRHNFMTAQRELFIWLRRNYGPRIVTSTTQITAIYLRRKREQIVAPDSTWEKTHRPSQGCA